MLKFREFIQFLFILAAFTGCRKGDPPQKTLTLFVAASLTDVIQEIGSEFESSEHIQLVYNFASSGALAQQLMASPRGDIFMSASEAWMDRVAMENRLIPDSRTSLLSNQLVIVADPMANYALDSPAKLADLDFRYLSIGDPAYVPVGSYARQWMLSTRQNNGSTLWSVLQDRIAPAPDARAALTQVTGNRNVVGVIYKTDYLSWKGSLRLLAVIPIENGPEIHYPAAIIASTRESEAAYRFMAFLECPEARAVFERYGFTVLIEE